MRGWVAGVILILLGAGGGGVCGASPEPGRGPFEERNQFPLSLLFLTMPTRGGDLLPEGTREIGISQTYANTFVGSAAFVDLATGQPDRIQLTADQVAEAQAANPGENLYFVDTESARTELRFRVAIGTRFEAGIEIPFLSYRGGTLDRLIENYHQAVGVGNANREYFVRDVVQLALTLPGDGSYFTDHRPDPYQRGDISVGGRVAVLRSAASRLAVSAMVKFPTGDAESLGGSGGRDVGLGVEYTRGRDRHRLHLAAGWTHPGNWSLFPDFRPADLRSASAAYEFVTNDRLSWIGQLQSQTSVFRATPGAAADLEQPSTEILGGVRWRGEQGRWFFEAAFIENIFNQGNGVDIGLRAGAGYRFGGR